MKKPYDAFRALRIFHVSILFGLLLFGVIAVSIEKKSFLPVTGEFFSRILQVILIIFSFTMLIFGYNMFKRRILDVRAEHKPGKGANG
jgi:hypothetical protein